MDKNKASNKDSATVTNPSVDASHTSNFDDQLVATNSNQKVTTELSFDYSVELIRPDDLLFLKFYFTNVDLVNGSAIQKKEGCDKAFAFIQIPQQHIGEELETLIFDISDRGDFKRKKSFLTNHSWLAFEFKKDELFLNERDLLNWEESLKLLTIDSFTESFGGTGNDLFYRKGYENALKQYKEKISENKLTSLELPYKMNLSPIAPAYDPLDNFKRWKGSFVFKDLSYQSRNWNAVLRTPWTYKLNFRNIIGEETSPNFKVISYSRPDEKDKCAELLPALVHRKELHHLSMMPETDRDILSHQFKFSALGGTTYLKYRNDNPLNFSTVAWEQDVKLARDNYVSITFRAVDIFTGLKLLVSIVSERRYKFGVSFLEKKYFVTYAENEKSYNEDVVISGIPFRKIFPKSQGIFFEPLFDFPETGTSKSVFLVTKPGTRVFETNSVIPFEYTAIDKNGKEHQFELKMAFIPAESFFLTEGKYQWNPADPNAVIEVTKPNDEKPIPFTQIGFLDPKNDEDYNNLSNLIDADCSGIDFEYKYRLVKNFDIEAARNVIKESLKGFKKHVLTYTSCYQANVESKITFAKIDGLKQASDIDENSSSATFNTKTFLLFSQLGDDRVSCPRYDKTFPLCILMLEADIRISQIDQMEGISSYRKVRYYENYLKSRKEIDEFDPENQKKILFELVNRKTTNDGYNETHLGNFFTQNYKSAGALVNPGITISHISVLDQGITYNHQHNKDLANPALINTSTNTNVRSISIFGDIEAEILGMSMTDIIGEFLDIEDIPVFNYLEKSQDSLKKLGAGYEFVKEQIQKYESEYKKALALVRDKELLLKKLSVNELKHWLESITEKFDTLDLYKNQLNSLYELSFDGTYKIREDIKTYVNQTFLPVSYEIYKKYTGINRKNVEDHLKKILRFRFVTSENQQKLLYEYRSLVRLVTRKGNMQEAKQITPLHFKEIVKIFCISRLIQGSYEDFTNQVLFLNNLVETETNLRASFYKELQHAFNEANLWSKKYLTKEVEKLEKQLNEIIKELKVNIEEVGQHTVDSIVEQLVRLLPFFREETAQDIDNIEDTIVAVNKLTKTYENYFNVYKTFGEQYYATLCNELNLNAPDLENIEQQLIGQLRANISNQKIKLSISPPPQAYEDIRRSYEALWTKLYGEIFSHKFSIKDYSIRVQNFRPEYEAVKGKYVGLLNKIDEKYHAAKNALNTAKAEAKELEEKINSFANAQLKIVDATIERKKQDLIRLGESDPNYQASLLFLNKLKKTKRKLEEASHQKFNYKHSTKNFKKASMGGVIEFVPGENTELNIDVNYEVQFDIEQIDRPPSIAKQDYYTKTSITDFKLSLLKLLNVDFEKISFLTGSTVKDNFSVQIRNVEFGGPLNFAKAFQEYLSNVSDNLVYEITTSFAKVGYGFAIPDFTAGYFNFFNLNLSAGMLLPFDPKKSLQLSFGFGSEQSKFGITVAGVFGGQGYFNIIAEPKRGIVGLVLVLEFGAIFYLDLFVARGTAYLVGGIYIKKHLGEYELRGYILCVGRFNVLSVFSASVTFYLGLEGNSDVLHGQCVVTVTKRFSRFFKLSVKCRMKKRIKGANRQSEPSGITTDNNKTNSFSDKFLVETCNSVDASRAYFASYLA